MATYHHFMLLGRIWYLHSASTPYGGVGDIAVSSNLIAGIHNHDSFMEVICQDSGHLPDDRCLANACRLDKL